MDDKKGVKEGIPRCKRCGKVIENVPKFLFVAKWVCRNCIEVQKPLTAEDIKTFNTYKTTKGKTKTIPIEP